MLVIVLAISLALNAVTITEAAVTSQLSDSGEQSGDSETGINPFNAEIPDLSEKSNEDEITKTFANQQQRQMKQQNAQRPQTKAKQRKADLNDDVNDFIELVPKAEIKAKIEEYYRNDMDVQHIFEYMHGKEFIELRKNILELPDVKETLQYLNKNGLNAKSLIRKLDHRLGVSKIRSSQLAFNPQTQFGTNTTIGGLNGLVEDVLALLPQDEIFMLFFEKLDSSPKFATFVQSIGDPSFHRKYTTLWKSKDLHSASAQLKKHKIDVVKIIQIIQGFFIFGTF
ncbi:protein G12 isoform X1 [Contarinia nasturtii]|uniref:protein G12 isoform X1 n=1 Tax=Contarinia nasturtii TaxID=265458 RepID=UPI0012D429EB|nr:protein G12 isoform X1 [Contarinia nasturtii]